MSGIEIHLAVLDERICQMQKALKLQAVEYERRLMDLNHAHEKAIAVQHTYVTQDKYEDALKAEKEARDAALTHADERFREFVARYEMRHEQLTNQQHDYVTQEKYEDKLKSEADARSHALSRIDEKFEEYVQRWELRQREMDQTIATLSRAATEARQIAESQGRQTRAEAEQSAQRQKDAATEAQRRQTRNITIMGIVLAAVVGIANLLPALL